MLDTYYPFSKPQKIGIVCRIRFNLEENVRLIYVNCLIKIDFMLLPEPSSSFITRTSFSFVQILEKHRGFRYQSKLFSLS